MKNKGVAGRSARKGRMSNGGREVRRYIQRGMRQAGPRVHIPLGVAPMLAIGVWVAQTGKL